MEKKQEEEEETIVVEEEEEETVEVEIIRNLPQKNSKLY